jgi:hypothetical protein
MAVANVRPAVDVQAGLAAFEEDLPRVLRALDAVTLDSLGWSRPNKMSLLVPMTGLLGGSVDQFVLRLGFAAYRTWPPSAQFVNPETGAFVYPQDQHHIPKLTSQECHTHAAYARPGGGTVQLICCSATMEFYDVLHSVESKHVWRGTETFLTTINAVTRALSSHYQGRFAKHG